MDYQLFLTFVQCLRKIGINYNRGSDYSKEKEMILGMLQWSPTKPITKQSLKKNWSANLSSPKHKDWCSEEKRI